MTHPLPFAWRPGAGGRRGVLLAGGEGTRLRPLTLPVSKQLLPVYDKPMVHYPLSVLMQAGIREVAIIVTPRDRPLFERLLGCGGQWGLRLVYLEQPQPGGLPQALLIAAEFLRGGPSLMVLGDNILLGEGVPAVMRRLTAETGGAGVLTCPVPDPHRYGVVEMDAAGRVLAISEKPARPASNLALAGFFAFDGQAPERAARLRPSARGELEIVDLLNLYLAEGSLTARPMARDLHWRDAGTHDSLLEAGNLVRRLTLRAGRRQGCPEQTARALGWANAAPRD
ncbi:MAG: NTP transferase domain-containing protein [Rhodobacteraceae bacterium]|nr:NTP transferase domain-containing protein [Paracoccaceae bacterium]